MQRLAVVVVVAVIALRGVATAEPIGVREASAMIAAGALAMAAEPVRAREATCADGLGGTWTAFNADSGHRFVLSIDDAGGGALRGTIVADVTSGAHCVMAATGVQRGAHVRFAAREKLACSDDAYALDRFTGALAGRVLAMVNNDDTNAFDRPYRFTRTRCAAAVVASPRGPARRARDLLGR